MPSAYIIAAARTPQGKLLGGLASLSAPQLASEVIRKVIQQFHLPAVDQVILGNVVSAGIGQAPARQQRPWLLCLTQWVRSLSIKFAARVYLV